MSLFFHFAKRTNQAEGCYQNFRLRDKLNYSGNSDRRRARGRKTATEQRGAEKKRTVRHREVKNGPIVNPSACSAEICYRAERIASNYA